MWLNAGVGESEEHDESTIKTALLQDEMYNQYGEEKSSDGP